MWLKVYATIQTKFVKGEEQHVKISFYALRNEWTTPYITYSVY